MPFWRLYYHLVWATRNREHLIQPHVEKRLYAYLIRKAAELGVHVYIVDGWYDQVHVIVSIPPKLAVAEVVKRLKGASSHYLNHETDLDVVFAWQRGYGALSFGERQRPIAKAYVARQKQHHQDETTNAWLERYPELDEGPTDTGMAPEPVSGVVREAAASYEIGDDLPF